MKHAYDTGLMGPNPTRKLSFADVNTIRELSKPIKSPSELAAQFGMSEAYIRQVIKGEARQHFVASNK